MSPDTQPAMSYPTKDQYARWKTRAKELDMSVSEFIQYMVEAGIKVDKGFELTLERDETNQDLREQRNDLKDELAHARRRNEGLEERLHHGERETIIRFVGRNPGATREEIVERVQATTWERVNEHLTDLEGEAFRVEDGAYFPVDGAGPPEDEP